MSGFRDDAQASRAIQCLLGSAGLGHLWTTSDGPGPHARDLMRSRDVPETETLLLSAAFDLRNNTGHAHLDRLLLVLDRARLRDLATLLLAVADGPDAVDGWLAGSGEAARIAAEAQAAHDEGIARRAAQIVFDEERKAWEEGN